MPHLAHRVSSFSVGSFFILSANVEVYHGVQRGARNGVDTTALLAPCFFGFIVEGECFLYKV